ncbi:MAG: virulence RhuM family protein [Bacteroidales bacterium]|nr:virulence RhuM family protein [Bacteroidales bacterium]
MNQNNGEIILYQPDSSIRLEVRMQEETVWLTQAQMAVLFGTQRAAITKHLNNIYNSGEIERETTCSKMEHVGQNGTRVYSTKYYNLDAILSVGYRVNSKNATSFRRWATHTLKEFLLHRYSSVQHVQFVEQRIDRQLEEHSMRILALEDKVGFFVRSALPPVEGIFYDGQIFDAYTFVADLIRSARERVIIIDNYVDDSVLKTLTKRNDGVSASIITRKISDELAVDLERHNQQYPPVEITTSDRYHDRFLIIDNTVYHLGASVKDLGKKLFAFNRMEVTAEELLADK